MEDLTQENATADERSSEEGSETDQEHDSEAQEDNSCVAVYFQTVGQTADTWLHQKCCLLVLEAIFEEKMFD